MQLLSPEQIKNDTEARITEQKNRARAAAEEEAIILKRLNDTKDEEERIRLQKQLDTQKEITPLEARKSILENEVAALEQRKAIALIPIEEKTQELEKREEKLNSRETSLVSREKDVEKREITIMDRAERLRDDITDIEERKRGLAAQEEAQRHAESDLSVRTNALADKWVEYHTAVHNQNEDHLKKEAEIEAGRKANAEYAEKLRLESFAVSDRERAVKDGWRVLLQSKEEYEKKHGND